MYCSGHGIGGECKKSHVIKLLENTPKEMVDVRGNDAFDEQGVRSGFALRLFAIESYNVLKQTSCSVCRIRIFHFMDSWRP